MPSKRGKGEGTIRQRTDGRWEITYMVGFNEVGKPKRHSIYGKTQQEVIDKAVLFQKQSKTGYVIDKRMTLSEWADIWLENHKDSIRKQTYESYTYTLTIVKSLVGKHRVYDIKPLDVEIALKKLIKNEKSRSQVSKVKAMLHQILRKAEANGLIEKNPVPLTDKLKMKKDPSGKDSYSFTEVGLLLKNLPCTRIGHAIRLAIACGVRTQELLALTPMHVDIEKKTLRIDQAVYLIKGAVNIGDTKTPASRRIIPIPDIAMESAVFLKENAGKHLLQGKNEMPINPSTYREYYYSAVNRVNGVRLLPPHCTRHTYITMLQASGIQMEIIQALAGHVDLKTTIGYIHIKDEVAVNAVGTLSSLLEQAAAAAEKSEKQ